jgi:hypothetical protein
MIPEFHLMNFFSIFLLPHQQVDLQKIMVQDTEQQQKAYIIISNHHLLIIFNVVKSWPVLRRDAKS